MKQNTGKRRIASTAERSVEPCNFRSAGQLSNESARVLTTLFESFARNVMNSLDVYLGTALEVKLTSLRQLTMDDYRLEISTAVYVMPCGLSPANNSMLLEFDRTLLFTMTDLLLGGSGMPTESQRELTEIDEEIVQGVAELIAGQVERIWEPIGITVQPGHCMKPSLVHKLFSPIEKVLVVECEVLVAGMSGWIRIGFPASVGSHLVRNIKADPTSRGPIRYLPRLSLQERILEAKFTLEGNLPQAAVPVRQLAALAVGDVFLLPLSVETPGQLTLEERPVFGATPVRSGNHKAVQLLAPIVPPAREGEAI